MTREETIKVLAILKAAFPASYRNMTKEEANGVVMIWATQFADVSYTVVMIAVQKLISVSNFPPTIAEVKSKLRGMYWEAYCARVGNDLLDNSKVLEESTKSQQLKQIEQECRKYHDKAALEPTLEELIGGVQNYITDGRERA